MQSEELKTCPMCGADEASTYIGAPGPGVVTCFAVGCGHTIKGFASDDDAIAEWNKRSDAMSAAMTEAYCSEGTEDDTLKECFLHHVRTTIGFLAFGMRAGPEMTMYEEGFKAGYRRCQSDNEPDIGEDEDGLNKRTRIVVAKLRESLRKGEVDPLAIDNAVDLLIHQSKFTEAHLSTDGESVKTAPSVAMKALEWKDDGVSIGADTSFGYSYRVFCIDWEGDPYWQISCVDGRFASEAKAKAAAQSDYEARIRSALSAQVQDVAGLESNPVTLRWWCQQLLDIIENHDITHDSCDEEIAMVNDIRASVDPAAPAAKQEGGTNE